MRVVDYIAERLSKEADTIFLLAGGGAMFLNDALSWHKKLTPVFCHHEQACAMAAEAYARVSGKLGIVNVTTGPGGINALNGVFGAWTDSVPMIVISGQVKRKTTLRNTGLLEKLRQLGDQEVDIISLAAPITKKAIYVSEIDEIPFVLEDLINLAKGGRPGPVWIDIPIDIQAAEIDPGKYFPCILDPNAKKNQHLDNAVNKTIEILEKSSKPLFLVGSGIRTSDTLATMRGISERLRVPIANTWTGVDIMSKISSLNAERPGVVGTRAGNIITQKADLIIVLGSRLPIRQVSYNWENFGKKAIKIGVDIDPYELTKPMVKYDVMINASIKDYLKLIEERISKKTIKYNDSKRWIGDISSIKEKLPLLDAELENKKETKEGINPYIFIKEFWKILRNDEIIAAGDASASVIPLQAAPLKRDQRIFTNAGAASMGYELPAAIGAAYANPNKRIICLAGDGSIMLNIQELETIVRYKLPIKIILLNNRGYLSIKLSQNNFFKREKGASTTSGLGFPSFEYIAKANEIEYTKIETVDEIPQLKRLLQSLKPAFIDVKIDPEQGFQPKLGSHQKEDGTIESNTLEDMSPPLRRETLIELMKDPNE